MTSFLNAISKLVMLMLLHLSNAEPDNPEPNTAELPHFTPRIAGGRAVNPGDVPYHLQLLYDDKYQCGAALVLSPHGNQVVITAAQCITQKSPKKDLLETNKLSVVAGRVRLNGFHALEQTRKITQVHRHPLWHRTSSVDYSDLAVLHISEPFEVNRLVQPIPLTEREKSPTGLVFISGWGRTSPNDNALSENLKVSALEIVDWKLCHKTYGWEITAEIQEDMFCAGTYESPTYQGACLGDTGGPATNVFNYTLYLVGIFDWGLPKCGNRYQPSVFMDLSHYLYWIKLRSDPSMK